MSKQRHTYTLTTTPPDQGKTEEALKVMVQYLTRWNHITQLRALHLWRLHRTNEIKRLLDQLPPNLPPSDTTQVAAITCVCVCDFSSASKRCR